MLEQIALKFADNPYESYGWYQKNHPEKIKEIEEYLFSNKIKTKEDFKPWLENAKRSLIQQNRNYRVKHNIPARIKTKS